MNTIYFQTMARYNRWMNGNIYNICEQITDEERKQNRGAPFRSIHGVLNHLLLADRIWLGRFLQQPFTATSLDEELYADFDELHRERSLTDDVIDGWVASLTEKALAAPLMFTPISNPQPRTFPLQHCVLHFFNHQTHHRGQVTAMIEQAGYDCGVTDLLVMPVTPS